MAGQISAAVKSKVSAYDPDATRRRHIQQLTSDGDFVNHPHNLSEFFDFPVAVVSLSHLPLPLPLFACEIHDE